MVALTISSQLFEQAQLMFQDIDTNPGDYVVADTYVNQINQFNLFLGTVNPTVVTLSSTLVALRYVAQGATYTLSASGTGIGPVGSLAALQSALDSGLATGAIDAITVKRGSLTILTLETSATGYSVTTGPDVYTVTGTLPGSLDEVFALGALLDQLDVSVLNTMTPAQRTAFFNDIAAFGVTGLSVTTDGNELFALAIGPQTLSLSLAGGLTLTLAGQFPQNFGELADTLYDLYLQSPAVGPLDLTGLAYLELDSLVITAPNGVDVLTLTGPITDEASTALTGITLDGVLRPEPFEIYASDWTDALLLTGTAGSEWFFGSIGAAGDVVRGGLGNDVIYGFAGDDSLTGDAGNDSLVGGAGNDVLNGVGGRDTIIGGDGVDTVIFEGRVNVTYDMRITTAQNTGHGLDLISGVENVSTFAGFDNVIGDSGRNLIKGGNSDDTLDGGAGIDTLNGGSGNDLLIGGEGVDVLFGAAGADRFQFTATSGRDIVMDYADGTDRFVYTGGVTFADLVISQSGADALITLGTSSVKLLGVNMSVLTDADFTFV